MTLTAEWDALRLAYDELMTMSSSVRRRALRGIARADPSLYQELVALLRHESAADLLDRPLVSWGRRAIERALPLAEDDLGGARLGPWRVGELIGAGGMGAVYCATRDDHQFEMSVAVKVMRRDVVDDLGGVERRFREERQIVAGLQHPWIVRLLDGGVTRDGRPYFVMERVNGCPVLRACDALGLSLRERIDVFHDIVTVVAHAHRSLVVHRDIHSSNVLLCEDRTVRLLDFGVARTLGSDTREVPPRTGVRSSRAPAHWSPEQIAGHVATTRDDVYALGVLLLQLLSGLPPEHVELAQGRSLGRRLGGDLDAIISCAIHIRAGSRYPSVTAISDDLRRHFEARPVWARRPTVLYRVSRLFVRHRSCAAGCGLVIAAIVAGWHAAHDQAVAAARARAVGVGTSNPPAEISRWFDDPQIDDRKGGAASLEVMGAESPGDEDERADPSRIHARVRGADAGIGSGGRACPRCGLWPGGGPGASARSRRR